MEPFNLETERAGKVLIVNEEKICRKGDEDGYIRDDVTERTRRAVAQGDVEDQIGPLKTVRDVETYGGALHYPEQLPVFSTGNDLYPQGFRKLAKAIRKHDRKLRSKSGKFMNRLILPDL